MADSPLVQCQVEHEAYSDRTQMSGVTKLARNGVRTAAPEVPPTSGM